MNHKRTFFRSTALVLAVAAGASALAQGAQSRIINIQGAPRGDMRNGPITFSGNPIKATVSTLNISASGAELKAPAGKTITAAAGERTATFSGDIKVNRGGLDAKGGSLVYNEKSGVGVLTQNATAAFKPQSGETVNIKAQKMSLDVDKKSSTSEGSVVLVQGNQSAAADKLIFDEVKELGVMTGNPRLRQAASGNRKELNITGNEVRALTANKTIFVKGNVRLVQGTITTTGDALFYDDKNNVAYVVGNAKSVDSSNKSTVSAPASGALEQRTDLGRVRSLNSYTIPTGQFELSR